mmetsp:Transcript_33731/g.50010  ORF Transcript_33731/g.50010 Transcript_33731/m.50010 type:complete len:339 (-) Transcript_33731:1900-2916(-)
MIDRMQHQLCFMMIMSMYILSWTLLSRSCGPYQRAMFLLVYASWPARICRPHAFCDAVTRCLPRCTSLRILRVSCSFMEILSGISMLTNLDDLTLEHVALCPQSLQSALRTAEKITLDCCLMLQEEQTTLESQPDCLEAWGLALRKNTRIRQFEMIQIDFDFQDPEGVGEALSTRPTLEQITLRRGRPLFRTHYERFEFVWEASHLRKYGGMESLQHLQIDTMGHGTGVLQAVLAPRPCNLRSFTVENHKIAVSDNDFSELLHFLSDPDCKLESLAHWMSYFQFDNNSNNTSIMHERFRPLIDVLKSQEFIRANSNHHSWDDDPALSKKGTRVLVLDE